MTREEAINIVQKHLDRHQPTEYRLVIFPESSRFSDDWWLISVGPDRGNIRPYDYYDVLARIEVEIEDEEANANISLMPPPSVPVNGD